MKHGNLFSLASAFVAFGLSTIVHAQGGDSGVPAQPPSVTVKGWDPYLKADLELSIAQTGDRGEFTGKFSDLRAAQIMTVKGTITPEVLRFSGVEWVGKKPWLATGKPSQFSAELPRSGNKFVGTYSWNGTKGDFEFAVPPGTGEANAAAVPKVEDNKEGLTGALDTINKGVDNMAKAAQSGADRIAGRPSSTGSASESGAASAGPARKVPTFSTEPFQPKDWCDVLELYRPEFRNKPFTLAPAKEGELDAPGGLRWGGTPEEVSSVLEKRGAVRDSRVTEAGRLVLTFRGGAFGGQTVDVWTAGFVDGGLFELRMQFYSATNDTMNLFRTVQKQVIAKYGNPNVIQDHGFSRLNLNQEYSEKVHSPYGENGRYWSALNKLQAEYASGVANNTLQVVSRWTYTSKDTISMHVVGHSDVLLEYTDGAGASRKAAANAEAANDF